jgi:hypothetical protein
MLNMRRGAGGSGGANAQYSSFFELVVVLLAVIIVAASPEAIKSVSAEETERIPYAKVYRAEIDEIPGTNSGVTGFVYVFASADHGSTTIGYAGSAAGLQTNLLATTCTAENGCGVHIHAGFSCETKESQGGHYYDNSTIPTDPWVDQRYSSNDQGEAAFNGIVDIGTDDLRRRVFISKSVSFLLLLLQGAHMQQPTQYAKTILHC